MFQCKQCQWIPSPLQLCFALFSLVVFCPNVFNKVLPCCLRQYFALMSLEMFALFSLAVFCPNAFSNIYPVVLSSAMFCPVVFGSTLPCCLWQCFDLMSSAVFCPVVFSMFCLNIFSNVLSFCLQQWLVCSIPDGECAEHCQLLQDIPHRSESPFVWGL